TSPQGDDFELRGEIKLDETAKPHKALDWVKFVDLQGNEIAENRAIYEIVDADTIRVCSGGPGGDRPTEFEDGDGGRPNLIVLKREAKAPKGDRGTFQGKWTTQVGREKNITLHIMFAENKITVSGASAQGNPFELRGELTLDENARPHKTMDWVKFVDPQGK